MSLNISPSAARSLPAATAASTGPKLQTLEARVDAPKAQLQKPMAGPFYDDLVGPVMRDPYFSPIPTPPFARPAPMPFPITHDPFACPMPSYPIDLGPFIRPVPAPYPIDRGGDRPPVQAPAVVPPADPSGKPPIDDLVARPDDLPGVIDDLVAHPDDLPPVIDDLVAHPGDQQPGIDLVGHNRP